MAEWQDADDGWLDRLRTNDAPLPKQRSSDPRDWLDLPWTFQEMRERSGLPRQDDRRDGDPPTAV